MGKFTKKILIRISEHVSPAMVAMILVAIISGILLFVPPINGLGDTGDFYRAMNSNGIYRLPSNHSQFMSYIVTKFGIYQYFNENHAVVVSTQTLFVHMALFLNKLFYSKTIFDIRFMGLVWYLFYLGAIYLLTKSLVYPHHNLVSYVIALIVVFILGDSSFTLYFNSFFGEPEMFIATIYSFAAIMLLARQCTKRRWPVIILFFVSTILLITSKQQNAPLALSFSVVAIGLVFLPGFKARRLAVIVGMGCLLISGIVIYASINKDFTSYNTYQAFSYGALMETNDPSKKIDKQGVNEQYALMRSQAYYSKTFDAVKPTSKNITKKLTSKMNIVWFVKYYLHNRQQFINLMDLAAKDVMITQVKSVGDYTRGAGHKPNEQVRYFTLYSSYLSAFYPGRFAFVCLTAIGFVAVYAVGAYRDFRSRRFHGILRFLLVVGLMTIFVFVPIISILGDGEADLAKHMFMAPLSFDLAVILFISDMLNKQLWNTDEGGDANA
ncbi:hypothetical protein ABTQ33_10065 [Paucilactobacillus suebicus]|uniref:Transmembrane protein n=1 Tax=Paucilactobacillus suebicus DSM 5007 = KCTC 3549 TaxID=1423807 RepID=A0A0R1W1D3_9LACO|nr:hypothetical protein [Paucilactobacillus suebicus]KRM11697.1 hypothetical protein FD16_GL000615 [Paucilactobacillus suebicus DSM 5007 = KCTC 3549]